jgi:outer membrane immunogenic protein
MGPHLMLQWRDGGQPYQSSRLSLTYVDLGTVSGAFVTPIVTSSGAFLVSRYSSRITDNILRVGLNYKVGGGL